MKPLLNLEEAAEHFGISAYELKLSRQRGLPPGSLGVVIDGKLVWRREDLAPGLELEESHEESQDELMGSWPHHIGGGYFELSDGTRIRGKQAALDAEALL